jgi:hypothetical protein
MLIQQIKVPVCCSKEIFGSMNVLPILVVVPPPAKILRNWTTVVPILFIFRQEAKLALCRLLLLLLCRSSLTLVQHKQMSSSCHY